jgi:CarboxypepD_reg-like domain
VGSGHISGRVVFVDDGQPLPGVTVCIEGRSDCVFSDANGVFSFSQVSAKGTITLTTDLVSFRKSSYPICVDPRGTTDIVIPVSMAMVISNCTYWGDPTLMRYEASGIVLGPGDAPLRGVLLEIRDSNGVKRWGGRSGRNGSFRVIDLADGIYTLHLSKRGYLSQSVTFDVHYCAPAKSLHPRLGPHCR